MKSFAYYFGFAVIVLGIVSVLATAYQTFFLKDFSVVTTKSADTEE